MLAHILAADFTLDRPQSPLGWIIIALAAATVGWIFIRGTVSLFDMLTGHLRPILLGLGVIALILFIQKVNVEKKDPLARGDIEVFVVEGIEATTEPADPGHQPVDPGHSHDGG